MSSLKKYFYQNYQELKNINKFDFVFISSLTLAPLLFLTTRGWMNFFLLFLSTLSIYKIKNEFKKYISKDKLKKHYLISLSLSLSFFSILITQLIRGDWKLNLLDGPLRSLIAISIFFYLLEKNIDFVKLLEYTIPISLIILAIYIFLNPYNFVDIRERFGTKSIDPLTLGQYSTLFGFICLFMIDIYQRDSWIVRFLKITGIAAATWISIGTASRSGWVAIPFLLIIWIIKVREIHQPHKILLTFAGLGSIAGMIYEFIPVVHDRISLAATEYIAYFNGDNTYTATGIRISMLRAATWLFLERPFTGYGDAHYPSFSSIPEIAIFNTEKLEFTLTHSGAHNEIMQSALRSGVFGLFSSILMLLIPAIIFYRGSSSKIPTVRAAGLVGLCYIVAIFFFSLSTETFNLKYTISFYALMVSALAAQVLRPQPV